MDTGVQKRGARLGIDDSLGVRTHFGSSRDGFLDEKPTLR